MAMTVHLRCAMCFNSKDVELDINPRRTKKVFSGESTLADVVAKAKWIGQQNGQNFDIYCCKRCAQ